MADCPKDVQVIKSGAVANCDGFLFSDAAEKRAAEARDDVEHFNKLVPKLEQKIVKEEERNTVLEKRLDLYIKQSDVLAKELAQRNNNEFIKNVGLVVLGAIVMRYSYDLSN